MSAARRYTFGWYSPPVGNEVLRTPRSHATDHPLITEAAANKRMIPFSDVARAAYCPRQLYYTRRETDRSVPEQSRARIDLAFRYPTLRNAPDRILHRLPIRRSPAAYRRNLSRLGERDDYDRLSDPNQSWTFLAGKDCHGTAHKVLEADGECASHAPVPTLVSPGEPPENGVWEPQTVRAVAVAKALAWNRQRTIPRALVEYPSVGVIRKVRLTTRTKATYRRALRAARAVDGPPPRVADNRCTTCEYREQCGTNRRTLRSLLG